MIPWPCVKGFSFSMEWSLTLDKNGAPNVLFVKRTCIFGCLYPMLLLWFLQPEPITGESKKKWREQMQREYSGPYLRVGIRRCSCFCYYTKNGASKEIFSVSLRLLLECSIRGQAKICKHNHFIILSFSFFPFPWHLVMGPPAGAHGRTDGPDDWLSTVVLCSEFWKRRLLMPYCLRHRCLFTALPWNLIATYPSFYLLVWSNHPHSTVQVSSNQYSLCKLF